MMNDGFVPGIIVGALVCASVFSFIFSGTDDSWKQQIADHGCGEFYLDANHNRQWHWQW